jgi:hypothetical protein
MERKKSEENDGEKKLKRERCYNKGYLQIQRSWVRFPALPDFLRQWVWNGVHSAS